MMFKISIFVSVYNTGRLYFFSKLTLNAPGAFVLVTSVGLTFFCFTGLKNFSKLKRNQVYSRIINPTPVHSKRFTRNNPVNGTSNLFLSTAGKLSVTD